MSDSAMAVNVGVNARAARVIRSLKVSVSIMLLAGLAACGDSPDSSSSPVQAADTDNPSPAVQMQHLIPDDPHLAEIYQTSCRACHIVPGTGAPQTGDVDVWKPRVAKGMGTLLNNVSTVSAECLRWGCVWTAALKSLKA